MSLFEILGTVLIGPLKLLFEVIFSTAYSIIQNPGVSVIVLSLAMNFLVLPLYRRADAIQIEARDTENKLKDTVAHIKKTFSGDERMMILQAYYRQNNYNPLSVLSGSISLLLEIPFFMAAYQFLSGVDLFQGVAFGPIADLSVPDGLIKIGSLSINALPIIMTLVNVVSSSLYLEGFPLKTKIQLYGMALFFLVFLYNSPAALVFYWTLNNTFSLVKTLFYKLKHSRKILNVLFGVAGAALIGCSVLVEDSYNMLLVICIGLAAQLPWVLPLVKKIPFMQKSSLPTEPNTKLFVMGALFLTALVGLLIPSTFVAASPQEYVDIYHFYHPVWYVIYTLCISAGTFLVWLGVFYWLANAKGKVVFSYIVWLLSGVMLVNYMFFGTNLGVVTADLEFTGIFFFARQEHIINIIVVMVLAVDLYLLVRKFSRSTTSILLVGAIALTGMGIFNIAKISQETEKAKQRLVATSEAPSFTMTEDGKNVVVIMLDRAIGPFVPYLMEENPTLQEQFDGFTYYSNTLSYGGFTNFGTPPLYGGYEYTPVRMNQREDESLADKHDEALKVMPTLFSENGYDVTLLDPSYAGYQWIPDLSIYDDMEGVTAYRADGFFTDDETVAKTIATRRRNFFMFSLMKTMPVSLQAPIYREGTYCATPSGSGSYINPAFLSAYSVMQNMTNMTQVTAGNGNTFMFLRSNMTHEAVILDESTYAPSTNPNYTITSKTITAGNSSIVLDSAYKISHYQVNMAALMELGAWFNELRAAGVYDNTRIIIVSDHGRDLGIFDTNAATPSQDIEMYLPMLLVKDFGATGFTTSDEFMTNADVPTLALDGLIENPVNPFTGNEINSDFKTENDKHYVILSQQWDININNGNQFLPSTWATVTGNVTNKDHWEFHNAESLFPPGLAQ